MKGYLKDVIARHEDIDRLTEESNFPAHPGQWSPVSTDPRDHKNAVHLLFLKSVISFSQV